MARDQTNSTAALPDSDTIIKAAELEIFDKSGAKVKFGSTFQDQKTIVVFIRHFFCGVCQAYIQGLTAISKDALERAQTKIVVIGCGNWEAIQAYIDMTGFHHGSIYADPSRSVYHALGMDIENLKTTPKGQERASYLIKSVMSGALESVWKGPMQHLSLIGKQGNISQLGGEFILGPGLACTFASRMQHTEDHIEIADLLKNAGVDA